MTISKPGTRAILIVLFAAAVWVRLENLNAFIYPYFKGESATAYRHAGLIAQTGTLPPVDSRAFWPDGYAPARVGPNGVEYVTGRAFRVVSAFSDLSLRKVAGRMTIVAFSLCVFTFYFLAKNLWSSRSAGLLAAFFVAFSSPLIAATYGRDYGHGPYALLLTSLHLGLVIAYLRQPSRRTLALAALVAMALAAGWETADLYIVLIAAVVVFAASPNEKLRAHFLAGHVLAMTIAGIVLTHLRAERYLASWPFMCLLSVTAYVLVKRWLPSKVPAWVYVAAATGALSVLARPFMSDGGGALSTEEYWLYRLRFLAGKPDDPLALSDTARFLWSHAHTYPSPYTLFGFFLPFVLLIPPAIGSLRRLRPEQKSTLWLTLSFAVGGVILFLIDRSAVHAAGLGFFPLAAVSACTAGGRRRGRIVAISSACVLMLLQALVPPGKANPTRMAASSLGLSAEPTDGFLWVSIGSADRELIGHLATRASVKDVILAPPAIASLLVGFGGRTAAIASGVSTVDAMQRTNGYMMKYYDPEDELFGVCDSYEIPYVLYSIDLLLDTSKDSPRFAAGLTGVNEESLAYRMHFEPESLEHFNLVYENDGYRLFRVTRKMEPFFLTDHPPVYQKSILARHDNDLRTFYEAIVDALLTYELALEAHGRGEDDEAIRRFRYCLELAPRFTKAWLGVGDSLFRLGEIEAANAAYSRALEAAPDNPDALYNTALTLARLGKGEEAAGLLDVLIASTRDRDTVDKAQDLKAHIEADAPLKR